MNVFSFTSGITISFEKIFPKEGYSLKLLKAFPVFNEGLLKISEATLKEKGINLFIRNKVQNLFFEYKKAGHFEKKPTKYSLKGMINIISSDGFEYEGEVHVVFYLSKDKRNLEFQQITLLENSYYVRKFLESKEPKKHY